jgi:hypothetical protein
MLKHSVTFSAETGAGLRADLLEFLGSTEAATAPPNVPSVEQRVAIELQDQVNELVGELKAAGYQVRELEKSLDQRDATLLAVAALICAVPDDALPSAVNAELERRAQRITMLEGDVRRLGAQLLDGKAPSETLKTGGLVTVTWPDGDTKTPGVIRGDDPETGRFLVEYYDMPPSGGSGETWADPEQLAHRSGNEPGDPPAEKPKRGGRKKKADEAEQTPPIDRDHYNAWKAEQEAAGITEGLDEMEFKRLKDAGVLPPFIKPEPKTAMTVNGVPLNEKLDPIPPHTTAFPSAADQAKAPYPNPAAPAEVQATTKARFEFEALPAPVLEAGAKVACWVNGAIAVGHFDRLNDLGWGAPTLSVKMLNGNLIDVARDEIRGVATDEPPAEEPPRQMAGVGASADDGVDDEFGGDW